MHVPVRLMLSIGAASFSSKFFIQASKNRSAAFAVSGIGEQSYISATTTDTVGSRTNLSRASSSKLSMAVDPDYPGTAVERMMAVRDRVKQVAETSQDFNGPWVQVRRKLLWCGGLRDLENAIPGRGYTGHSFNDFNHVDLTAMRDDMSDNENDGSIQGIALGNRLGNGIRVASLPELGQGGSWSTCMMGCQKEPPQDVAHIQFRSRIAFKLVWVPNESYDTFVLVDDDGAFLAKGTPSDGPKNLPSLRERMLNYQIVKGSKYAVEADKIAQEDKAFQ